MAGFDMGRAWNEAAAVLSRDGALIAALVAGGAIAGAILQYGVFGFSDAEFAGRMAALGTGNADPTAILSVVSGALGAVFAGALVSGTASMAATRMVVARGSGETIGSALGWGVVAMITLTLFYIVAMLGIGLVVGLLAALFSLLGAAVGAIFAILLVLILIPAMIWLIARLFVITPAMAEARSVNPLFGVAQSWTMTREGQWPLLGYLLLLILAGIVIALVLGLAGMVFTAVIPGRVGEALASLVTAVPIGILSVAVMVGVWRTIRPDQTANVFS